MPLAFTQNNNFLILFGQKPCKNVYFHCTGLSCIKKHNVIRTRTISLKHVFILLTDCAIYIYIAPAFFLNHFERWAKTLLQTQQLGFSRSKQHTNKQHFVRHNPSQKLPEVARNFFFKKHKVSWKGVKEKWLRLAWLFYWVGRQGLFFEISWEKLFPKQNKKTHKWKLCHFQKLTFWHA